MTAATYLAALSAGTGAAAIALLASAKARRLWERQPVKLLRAGTAAHVIARRLTARPMPTSSRVPIGSRNWTVLKMVGALCGCVFALAAAPAAPGRSAPLVLVGGPTAGFMAPNLWLTRALRRRLEAAVSDLPNMLDLLRVAVEAGMTPQRALATVGTEFTGPLATEWRRVAAEMALGTTQDAALAGMAARLPAEEVSSFVDALTRSRRHGVPLGRTLAAQALRARHRRGQLLRERAARAGPKIQLVVALVLVPSVLLMVAAGLVAELQGSSLALLPQ
jgi:tight adherence protein C